jgi:hypothetical protein
MNPMIVVTAAMMTAPMIETLSDAPVPRAMKK